MATYQFETITAAQALAITPTDTLLVSNAAQLGPNAVVVMAADAGQPERVELTFGGRTVTFSANLEALSLDGRLIHSDSQGAGPAIVIGTAQSDGIAVNVPVAAIYGGGGDDGLAGQTAARFFGGAGADTLQGGASDQLFVGGDGDDLILPAGGADTVDGGAGIDTVVLAGRRADFTIVRQGDGLSVRAGDGAGPVTLQNVERLRFSDGDYSAADLLPVRPGSTSSQHGEPGWTHERLDVVHLDDLGAVLAMIWQGFGIGGGALFQELAEPQMVAHLVAGVSMSSLIGDWTIGA